MQLGLCALQISLNSIGMTIFSTKWSKCITCTYINDALLQITKCPFKLLNFGMWAVFCNYLIEFLNLLFNFF